MATVASVGDVWRIRIPKLNLDFVPKSCKFAVNQVVWRIRIRKVRFPKLILHRGLEAFVDICFILFFGRIRIPKLNLDLVPRSCKYAVNQVVWRIRITKLNLDSVPKSCKNIQNIAKLGSLEDQGPKSKISKIIFASWIRGF